MRILRQQTCGGPTMTATNFIATPMVSGPAGLTGHPVIWDLARRSAGLCDRDVNTWPFVMGAVRCAYQAGVPAESADDILVALNLVRAHMGLTDATR